MLSALIVAQATLSTAFTVEVARRCLLSAEISPKYAPSLSSLMILKCSGLKGSLTKAQSCLKLHNHTYMLMFPLHLRKNSLISANYDTQSCHSPLPC